jgi:hypothetical protein
LRKNILIVGVILSITGVIFLPISQVTATVMEWVPPERVVTYQGEGIPHILRVYLVGGSKYRLVLDSTTHIITMYNARLEIRDPRGNVIYRYRESESGGTVTSVEFLALESGTYVIEWWGYYRDEKGPIDLIYIEKILPPRERVFRPLEGLLVLGILMIIVGAGICILGALLPERK